MIRHSTEPEYSLEEKSEKTNLQWVLGETSVPNYLELVADLERLQEEVNTFSTTLEKIRSSVRGLGLSLVEQW